MVGYLFAVGPACAGDVLTFKEIRAWSDLTGHALSAWEVETLHHLSRVYLAEHQAASAPDRPMPGAEKADAKASAEAGRKMILAMMGQYEPAPGQGPREDQAKD